MKNPFKKGSVTDTIVNVGIGGAANVAMDYIFSQVSALAGVAEYKDIIKIAVGAFGGSMVSGANAKYIRPALDGIATVGAANLIASYMPTAETETPKTTEGVPFLGALKGRKFRSVRGTGEVAFQGK